MTQAHCFLAMELALVAQEKAHVVTMNIGPCSAGEPAHQPPDVPTILPTSFGGSAPCRRRTTSADSGRSAFAPRARPRRPSKTRSRAADRAHLANAWDAAFRRGRGRSVDPPDPDTAGDCRGAGQVPSARVSMTRRSRRALGWRRRHWLVVTWFGATSCMRSGTPPGSRLTNHEVFICSASCPSRVSSASARVTASSRRSRCSRSGCRPSRTLERDAALGELARRYFASHGPATVQDFAWWAGLTVTDARTGLESVKPALDSEGVDGRELWFAKSRLCTRGLGCRVSVPPWDEFTVAYRDRRDILDPKYATRVNAGGGILSPVIVVARRRGRHVEADDQEGHGDGEASVLQGADWGGSRIGRRRGRAICPVPRPVSRRACEIRVRVGSDS